jgi:hypothetical protein
VQEIFFCHPTYFLTRHAKSLKYLCLFVMNTSQKHSTIFVFNNVRYLSNRRHFPKYSHFYNISYLSSIRYVKIETYSAHENKVVQ